MGSGTYYLIDPTTVTASNHQSCRGGDDDGSQQQQKQRQWTALEEKEIEKNHHPVGHSSRRTSPTRICREWLIASIVLILLHCDMVRGVSGSGSKKGAPQDEVSESPEMQRIQDLVLRGLNITRIPRASEVSFDFRYYLGVIACLGKF